MTLDNIRDSNTQSTMPMIGPVKEVGGILETLTTSQNEEDLNSILSMAQFNANFNSKFTNSTTLGNHAEPYICLPSYQMSLSRIRDNKKQQQENTIDSTNLLKTKVQTNRKPRFDIVQENPLKELQKCNPQLSDTTKQYKQSNCRGLHLQMPKQQIGSNCSQEQAIQQEIFAPLLDGGLCSRRFKQYLYHQRNNKHVNSLLFLK